jgi:hypothetical protein
MNESTALDDTDPWLIPLHGIEAPAKQQAVRPVPDESALASFFEADDEVPSIEYRPRLRRSA